MIPRLSSPAVCVIDDEQRDYQPILNALLKLGIASVHVQGDSASPLPPQPFKGLRIVFTDLYLSSGGIGKTAAAHTANVFTKVVSSDTAPVLVVIWSKHTDERGEDSDLPPEDQPTAAELFKSALLEAEPLYRDRLIFTVMAKPKPGVDRPEDDAKWIKALQVDIEGKLQEFPACDMLWSWESLVREASVSVSKDLTSIVLKSCTGETSEESNSMLDDNLKLVFQHLAKEQGGPDCTKESAHRHLSAVLAQTLADELEHVNALDLLANHCTWISQCEALPKSSPFASKLNAHLLTGSVSKKMGVFMPGTVYRSGNSALFATSFGLTLGELLNTFIQPAKKGLEFEELKSIAIPVAIEISPACDFHQGTRRQAMLLGGLLVPGIGKANIKTGEAIQTLPTFNLRWPLGHDEEEDVVLTVCCRYKLTIAQFKKPRWLVPWFRLRELPTAALRNWHASHSARVGYVSLR